MNRHIKQIAGVTLLEVLLVLSIAASLFYMSLKVYYAFKVDSDVAMVRENVDAIFDAMAKYYRVACYGQTTPAGVVVPGELNPTHTPEPTNPYPINVAASLQAGHYLTTPLGVSPVVDATVGTKGYVAQFNRTDVMRQVIGGTQSVGTIVIWKMQVAVKIDDASKAPVYLKLLGGDCLSTAGSDLCSSSTGTGDYVIWERSPSMARERGNSVYWISMPWVKQFSQMYTTYPIVSVLNGLSTQQYYLCTN